MPYLQGWSAVSSGRAHENFVERYENLHHDQRHNRHFEPHAALDVDDIVERTRVFVDHRKLAREAAGTLLELVLVFEARIEPVELGLVPQEIRLLLDRNPSRHAVMDQQRLPDRAQDLAPV